MRPFISYGLVRIFVKAGDCVPVANGALLPVGRYRAVSGWRRFTVLNCGIDYVGFRAEDRADLPPVAVRVDALQAAGKTMGEDVEDTWQLTERGLPLPDDLPTPSFCGRPALVLPFPQPAPSARKSTSARKGSRSG